MDMEKLVEDYIDAWNRQDVAGILELLHNGAALYDAFWMENCVGKDLHRYLQDSIDEENHWYQQIGGVISVDNGVAYRYSAHERIDSTIGPAIYDGADVLIVLDKKILTASDYYCNPDPTALKEVAELAAKRHGVTDHAKSGLGVLKLSRVKAKLSAAILQDKSYLDPNLTLSRLADKIGCSEDHLSHVIDRNLGTDFHSLLESHRIEYAQAMLQKGSADPNHIMRVATEAGFRSFEEFNDSFSKSFGQTPAEFCERDD